jgi:N-acetylglutamate synthase-like GNAT family acetyltransferase
MQVVKITEPNPQIEREIRDLFAAEGFSAPAFEEAACFVVFDSRGAVEGAAFVSSADDACFMHAVVVRADSRKKGLGSALVSHILSQYSGAHEGLYIAVKRARSFFERFGFKEVSRESLPEAIAETVWIGAHANGGAPLLMIDLLRGREILKTEGHRHDVQEM